MRNKCGNFFEQTHNIISKQQISTDGHINVYNVRTKNRDELILKKIMNTDTRNVLDDYDYFFSSINSDDDEIDPLDETVRRKVFFANFNNEVKYQRICADENISPEIIDTVICVDEPDYSHMTGYILMEKINGITLCDFYEECCDKKNFKLYKRVIDEIVQKWLLLLSKYSVMHNDLHNKNIIIDSDNKPWFIDFGILVLYIPDDIESFEYYWYRLLENWSCGDDDLYKVLLSKYPVSTLFKSYLE